MTLTREEILAMEPGRKLDVAVYRYIVCDNWVKSMYSDIEYETSAHYSTDLSAAYEVLANEKSHQLTYSEAGFSHSELKYRAIVGRNQDVAYAKTAPEAICKARLLAVLNL